MEDSALRLLGIAFKAGKLAVGEEPVAAAARARQARVILLAADAADNSARRAAHFAQAWGSPMAATPWTKDQLGAAIGRDTLAIAAITDVQMALALVAALPQEESNKPALEVLTAKAAKARQRQQEAKAHRRNLRRGKKHVK